MLYQRPSFTLPAANIKTSEQRWDLAMLTEIEFEEKYNKTKEEVLVEIA